MTGRVLAKEMAYSKKRTKNFYVQQEIIALQRGGTTREFVWVEPIMLRFCAKCGQ